MATKKNDPRARESHSDVDFREQDNELPDDRGKDSNPDAITGEPGSHPVGAGLGAAAGGAAWFDVC